MKSTTYNINGCTIHALVIDINSYAQMLVCSIIPDGRTTGTSIISKTVNPGEPYHAHDAWFDVWTNINKELCNTALKVELANFFEMRCMSELRAANEVLGVDTELIAINQAV